MPGTASLSGARPRPSDATTDFAPYEELEDVTTNDSQIAGRFTGTDQKHQALVANYQLVHGRFWGHFRVWTPVAVTDPHPNRNRLVAAFDMMLAQAAG